VDKLREARAAAAAAPATPAESVIIGPFIDAAAPDAAAPETRAPAAASSVAALLGAIKGLFWRVWCWRSR